MVNINLHHMNHEWHIITIVTVVQHFHLGWRVKLPSAPYVAFRQNVVLQLYLEIVQCKVHLKAMQMFDD